MTNKLLPGYFRYSINQKFVSKKWFYRIYEPVQTNKYEELTQEFTKQNIYIDRSKGMLEAAPLMWFGKVWLAHDDWDREVKWEFLGYKLTWDHKQIKNTYVKIATQYPSSHNFYNIHLSDPQNTPNTKNQTIIIFQI